MANSRLPAKGSLLSALARKMESGMLKLGSELKLTYISPAEMRAARSAFAKIDASYNAARSAQSDASKIYQASMVPLYKWVLAVKKMLQAPFGTFWSPQWVQVGFITPSVAIPTTIVERLALAGAMEGFFSLNPDYEVEKTKLTAARGLALGTAALAAQVEVATATAFLNSLDKEWAAAYARLSEGMQALVDNLSRVLAKEDPRWLRFGLRIPAMDRTPPQPQNLAVVANSTGGAILSCDPVAMTTRYRWRTRIAGAQADFTRATSTLEPLAVLPWVPPGMAVEVMVQAVNGNLQSVASAPVVFTMPAAAVAGAVAMFPGTRLPERAGEGAR